MKTIIILIALAFLLGCAATITVGPDGVITAKDYSVKIDKDGSKTFVPNRWFSTAFLSSLFQQAAPIAAQVLTPIYVPTPAPVPVKPYP